MGAYFRKVWLGFYTVLLGMRVTLKYLFSHAITLQYPDEKWEIPDGFRGKLENDIDDCIGCLACSRACPVDCITIKTKKAPKGLDLGTTSDGTKRKLVVPQFDIDISTCLYCGLCVEACPTCSIRMTKEYEYSTYDRDSDLLLHFGKDLDPEVEAAAIERGRQLEEAEAAKKAEEAAKAGQTETAEGGVKKAASDEGPAGGATEAEAAAQDAARASARPKEAEVEDARKDSPQSKDPAGSADAKVDASDKPPESPERHS